MNTHKRKCKTCRDTESWHGWAQAPYCSPYCRGDFNKSSPLNFTVDDAHIRRTNERYDHKADILQPFVGVDNNGAGVINPDFVKVHGTKHLEKQFKVSREEILRAAER